MPILFIDGEEFVSSLHRPPAPLWIRLMMILALIILTIPLFTMTVGSVFEGGQLTLKWFLEVIQDEEIQAAMGRSVVVAIVAGAVSTLLGLIMAFGIEKYSFRGRSLLQFLSMVAMLLPELVFALSLLSWFVILRFELSLLTVGIAHVTFSISFSALIIGSRMLQLDTALEDAAQDLGAGEVLVLRKVLLPQLSGAILSSFLICLILSFDDFLITFFVNGVGQDTLPIRLFTSTKMGFSPKYNALATMMVFVTSCVAFLLLSLGMRQSKKNHIR